MSSSDCTTVEVLPVPVVERRAPAAPPLWLIITAFAAVYVVWGSTYLGIRIAIGSIPPMLMAGGRYFIAGLLLYTTMRLGGAARPAAIHWKSAAIIGALLLFAGNGGVTWAEQTVPSNIAALMVAAVPIWVIVVDWLRPQGTKPSRMTVGGIILGFAGVAFIVLAKGPEGAGVLNPMGAVVLVIAPICWAIGSVYSRHARQHASSLLNIGMQMICGGGLMLAIGSVNGEASSFHFSSVTRASLLAFLYLVFFGSLIGFTAYVWLLRVCAPSQVSTYAYVNPLIAIVLGWMVLGETLPVSAAVSGALIVAAVILITRAAGKRTAG